MPAQAPTAAEEKARLAQVYASPAGPSSSTDRQNGIRAISTTSSFPDERALYEAAIRARDERAGAPLPRTVDREAPATLLSVAEEKARLKAKYERGPRAMTSSQTNGLSNGSSVPAAALDEPTLESMTQEKERLRKKYAEQDSGMSSANSRCALAESCH